MHPRLPAASDRAAHRLAARSRAAVFAAVFRGVCAAVAAAALAPAVGTAQSHPPAIDYQSIFGTRFFENGRITFGDVDVVFAPPPPADASVAVRKADGTVVGRFDYFPDYVFTDKVFARMRVRGPADVTLPGPGDYLIEFAIGGRPATRFPFTLRAAAAGGDPFDPNRTFHYDGPWRRLAFLQARDYKDTKLVDVVSWLGSPDLPPGRTQDQTVAKLLRDGQLIAHSRAGSGGPVAAGPYREVTHAFLRPHEARQAHAAPPLTMPEFMVDGDHEIRIERQSDGALLRAFRYTIAGGRIQPLPRSTLGHQPAVDFIPPRVFAKNSGRYEFREAIWLAAR